MYYVKNYLKMDKIDRLLDAVEHPDLYSEKDMEAMLADPEVKEVYDLLGRTKAALAPIPSPDVDAEWKEFERVHRKNSSRILNLFSRNVAASIAIGIASLAAVAAVVGVSVNYALNQKAETPLAETAAIVKETVVSNDSTVLSDGVPAVVPEIIVFDNEPLKTIADRIAEYYGYKAQFSEEAPKTLRLYFRWNQAQTLDEVVESLNNFEQIHISVKDRTIKID